MLPERITIAVNLPFSLSRQMGRLNNHPFVRIFPSAYGGSSGSSFLSNVSLTEPLFLLPSDILRFSVSCLNAAPHSFLSSREQLVAQQPLLPRGSSKFAMVSSP